MLVLRIIAVIQALSLILGETYRSWGAGRHWLFVVDDYWISALLLAGAWAMKTDSLRSRALLAAGWGANAGMLYELLRQADRAVVEQSGQLRHRPADLADRPGLGGLGGRGDRERDAAGEAEGEEVRLSLGKPQPVPVSPRRLQLLKHQRVQLRFAARMPSSPNW